MPIWAIVLLSIAGYLATGTFIARYDLHRAAKENESFQVGGDDISFAVAVTMLWPLGLLILLGSYPVSWFAKWFMAPVRREEQAWEQRKLDFLTWVEQARDIHREESERLLAYEVAKSMLEMDPRLEKCDREVRIHGLEHAMRVMDRNRERQERDDKIRRERMERQNRLQAERLENLRHLRPGDPYDPSTRQHLKP